MLEKIENYRTQVIKKLDSVRRNALGQFLTPSPVARLMASMFSVPNTEEIRLLDPGAGIGVLFTAFVEYICANERKPKSITIIAYEIEPLFIPYLVDALEICGSKCRKMGIKFHSEIRQEDFVSSAASTLKPLTFQPQKEQFTSAILNPPYFKIKVNSKTRKILHSCGIETSNIYTGFLALTSMLLANGGQMVSITPRSFCNGVYFKSFRKQFLKNMSIERLHLFESRSETFKEDNVLQENIIMSARKGVSLAGNILLSSSYSGLDSEIRVREVERSAVILPDDSDLFIHVLTNDVERRISQITESFKYTLDSLGIQVSTGRVVDFRNREYLTSSQNNITVPLIYPANLRNGYVEWPIKELKKPNSIMNTPKTARFLIPSKYYVLVKRFSSKEERKRVVAAVSDPHRISSTIIGLDNHLNYFHMNQEGLEHNIAKGLAVFLNSSVVDMLFRNFSGHTQVNAADLRKIKYPSIKLLECFGKRVLDKMPNQLELDTIVENCC